jgi:hypothetical protein
MRTPTALALVVLLGCSGSDRPVGDLPELHPVKGKVVRGGEPVSGGELRLSADATGADWVINAEVGPDGTFELKTLHALSMKMGPGAPAGTWTATYSPPLTTNQAPVPVRATKPVTVAAGPNEIVVELPK